MWDRARASATAGLDRMHRRHLTGTSGGISTASYSADGQHASEISMSWTTISTSTSSSTFYQTNADGPANALGIQVVAKTAAAAPQRPPRPQVDALSVRVASARHTGILRTSTDDPADYPASSPPHPGFEPPPRNPRRLLRPRPSKDSNPEPQIVTDSESNYSSDGDGYSSSPAPNFELAAMYSRRRPPALDQISPPSSPETGAFKYDAPVSPIDDEDADFSREVPFQGSQRQQQSFTTPRYMPDRPVETHQYRAYQPPVEPMPLTFENPRNLADVPVPHVALPRSNKMRLPTVNEGSVAQRFKFLTKGASAPTENLSDRSEAPVHIPRRSSKRISRLHTGPRNISAPLPSIQSASELETPPRQETIADRDLLPSARAQRTGTAPSNLTPQHVTNALPTPPPNQRYPTPQSMESARARSPSIAELTPTALRIIKRKPAKNLHQIEPATSSPATSSPAYTNPPPRRASAAAATTSAGLDETAPQRTNAGETWTQPPSRFSVTTYATSNAGTPQQAFEEQMPTMTKPAAPVVTRPGPFSRREIHNVPSAGHTIAMPKQRAQMSSPYGAGSQIAASSEASLSGPAPHGRTVSNMESSTRRGSLMSITKPLPPAPPELASSGGDRITQLSATLSALAHRKLNITKSIHQMTELMPRDNLMASAEVLRKREIEKQKVEGLKEELADIQREEYDLGLKLHRAYKRQEKDAEYEPTTLWVRRITTN
ncbi:hypothetical protein ACQKWADRAFT_285060 [Trichoderma austrokoningii]